MSKRFDKCWLAVDALEAGDYDATGLEEVDLAERFTQSLLEDASGGY